jgi:predicted TIM-barrel fold metal-dependent hydrolase
MFQIRNTAYSSSGKMRKTFVEGSELHNRLGEIMDASIKKLKIQGELSEENYFLKLILVIAVMIITALPLAAFGQTTRNGTTRNSRKIADTGNRKIAAQQLNSIARQPIVPLADHHTHLWSLNASTLVTEPLLPVVELPDDLKRLLQDKERFGGRDKNPSALADLYMKDVLVMNPGSGTTPTPFWLRGERAIRFVTDSTVIARLLPTAFDVNGSSGYVAGYEAAGEGASTRYLNNFLYVIKKGADGKWKISSEVFTVDPPPVPKAITAEQLIAEMDAAGVKRAAVLSVAFWFGNPRRKVEDEYAKVRAENDWVAEQVARYRDRLVGFCSFNPLKDYAIEELNRCVKNSNFKGLKLHIGNSRVDVLNPQHIEKLRAVFRAANEKRFPILIHLWTSVGNYGRAHAEAFLNQILPVAPDIPIQIAHMAASGPNYHSDDAFEVYAAAAARGDLRMKNVYTDVASMVTRNTPPETLELVAKRLRQFGLQRVLFGSDRSPGFGNDSPKDAWEAFRRLPLTEKEFRIIAENVAPYMR